MLFCLLVAVNISGQTILDLSVKHAAYDSVLHSVNNGYMTLYQNQTFQGNRTVSREELAIILYKIHQENIAFKLKQTEIDSLSQLSTTFTPTIRSIISDFDALNAKFEALTEENKALHRDISNFQSEAHLLLRRTRQHRYWIYGLSVISLLNLIN